MARRHANLIVVPEGGGETRHYRIPLLPVAAFVAAGVLLAGVLFIAGYAMHHAYRAQGRLAIVEGENRALRGELLQLGGQIARLNTRVSEHVHLANESRLLAGLPPHGQDIARLGVGGTPRIGASRTGEGLTPSLERTVEVYHDRLDQFSRQLAFQEQSFLEVRQLLEGKRDELNHIPTINPVDGPHYVSSGFGMRRDPFTGRPRHHSGIDLCAPRGTPFVATANGTVVHAGNNGGFGRTVKIDHGNGFITVYGHADKILVKKGDEVRRGDRIGQVGDSGRSTGVHLHYEIQQNEAPVNPWRYFLESDSRIG